MSPSCQQQHGANHADCSLQVLLGQVLQVPLGEGDIRVDGNLGLSTLDGDIVTEVVDLALTLIRSWRNFSKLAQSMMPSSTGRVQSTVNLRVVFLPFLPLEALAGAGFFAGAMAE